MLVGNARVRPVCLLACAALVAGCGARETGGADAGACAPAARTYHLAELPEIDVLVVVDPTTSLHGESTYVRQRVGQIVRAITGRGPGYYEHTRLAFTTTAELSGELVTGRGAPRIIDAATTSRLRLAIGANDDLNAAFEAGAGPQGMLALTRVVERSGLYRKGDVLSIALFSDRDDASPATPDDYASRLVTATGKPNLGMELWLSVGNGDAPDRCVDTACEAACTSADPTATPCSCGGAAPSVRWEKLGRLVPYGLVGSICRPPAPLSTAGSEPQRMKLFARPPGDDPALVTITVAHAGGRTVTCHSPAAGQVCADGADWSYDPAGPYADFCQAPDAGCSLDPGSTVTIRVARCP